MQECRQHPDSVPRFATTRPKSRRAAIIAFGLQCELLRQAIHPELAFSEEFVPIRAGAGAVLAHGLASGMLSGIVSRLLLMALLYPLDTIRVRVQAAGSADRRPFSFRDAYAGSMASIVSAGPAAGAFFAGHDVVRAQLEAAHADPLIATVLAASAGSAAGWVVRTPFEAAKTAVQGGLYPDTWSALSGIVRSRGLAGAWERFPGLLVQYLPGDPVKMLAYRWGLDALAGPGGGPVPLWQESACGAVAYALVCVLSNPFSVANTRLLLERSQPLPPAGAAADADAGLGAPPVPAPAAHVARAAGVYGTAVRIGREEGAGALLAGLGPRVGKAAASGFLSFGLYELSRTWMLDPAAAGAAAGGG